MAAAGTTVNMKLLFDRIFGISVAQIRVHAGIPLKNDTLSNSQITVVY